MCLLPIAGADSILYGSCDGLRTIHDNKTVDRMMKEMAENLNLAKHSIGHQPNSKKLWTAGDIEVHLGSVCIGFFRTILFFLQINLI